MTFILVLSSGVEVHSAASMAAVLSGGTEQPRGLLALSLLLKSLELLYWRSR